MTTRQILCFGFGYSAQWLAAALPRAQWRIIGTRRLLGADPLAALLAFNGDWSPELDAAVRSADAVLLSIPPDEQGDPALRVFAAAFAARTSGWIGYLSTTGIYGDLGGRWAFEWSLPQPQSGQAARRVLAETQALQLPRPACIFRLPGIYGPGRSALDRLRAGETSRIQKADQVFSRIHVADLAAALILSIEASRPGRIYNICDDEPAPSDEVTAYAGRLLGLQLPPPVPFGQASLSSMAARFWAENKRVSNARAKAELGWRPGFPSYREGLASIFAADSEPTQ